MRITTKEFVMPGPTELIIIAVVLILLFGAKRLPDLARGSGQALRIFKSETKGLASDDAKTDADPHGRPLPPSAQSTQQAPPPAAPPAQQQSQDGTSRDQQL
jgi:sec-independent protein translocase protein TatA